MFSFKDALTILEVIQEVFSDIPNFEENMTFFSKEQWVSLLPTDLSDFDFDIDCLESYDSDTDF